MAGRTRRDEQKLRSDASVHRIGAIHPGGMLRIGFTKFHYGTTCCRLTRSPPPPPPPALNSPDKAVIGCLRIYWGRSPPMEMRNIIAFRCSIMGCGIAARPSAVFTFGTLRRRMRIVYTVYSIRAVPNRIFFLSFSLFLLLIRKTRFFFRSDRNTGLVDFQQKSLNHLMQDTMESALICQRQNPCT